MAPGSTDELEVGPLSPTVLPRAPAPAGPHGVREGGLAVRPPWLPDAVEAALEAWRRGAVQPAVERAAGDERLVWRLEAETLAALVREALLEHPPGAAGDGGDALERVRMAVELRPALLTALERACRLRGETGAVAPILLAASRAVDDHLAWLHRLAEAERSLLGEALVSLRALFSNLRDGIIFLDRRGRIVDVNRSILTVTGLPRPDVVGRHFREVWPQPPGSAWEEVYRHVLSSGETRTLYGVEYQPPRGRGPIIFDLVVAPRRTAGRIVGTVSTVHYRTEQALLERKLRHADKMATMGRLATSVSHEFRNLIAGVRALAELGGEGYEAPQRTFQRIVRVADQATEVTRDLLSFSRRTPPRLEEVAPRALLEDTADLALPPRLRGRIQLAVEVAPELPPLHCDRGHIQQALVNLARNAVHAMRPRGGTLTLGAALAEPGQLELSVQDTGPGIAEEIKQRIFEPFFTTGGDEFGPALAGAKPGTGLGLSLVKAIVERHGGTMAVRSEPGRGARFAMRLPLHPGAAEVQLAEALREPPRARTASAAPAPAEASPAAPAQGDGAARARVLVVDDEKLLRQIVRSILSKAGYEVQTASSVGKARRRLQKQPFDLVLLDLVVPGMQGPATLRRLRQRHPELKIAVLTGQALSDEALQQVLELSDAFIEKPFQVADIVGAARDLLAQARRDA